MTTMMNIASAVNNNYAGDNMDVANDSCIWHNDQYK